MDSLAVDSTIVENWRVFPPSSYSLKINKLWQLSLDIYESRYFPSGGYNWRLAIFPKGNKEENGEGYVSMYVEIDSTIFMSKPQSEVFAYLTFFVFSKKENRYFTIHDVEVKRFNALRKMWGFPRVLPTDIFNDSKNGYIFEGEQCEFGVDVLVVSPFNKWEITSFNEEPNTKFSWSIKKFSKLKENKYISEEFSMGGKKWALELSPKGEIEEGDEWLSIYLCLADKETLETDEKIYVRAKLKVVSRRGSYCSQIFNIWCKDSYEKWGAPRFLTLSEVKITFLDKKGSLNLEIEFEVVSATQYSPIILSSNPTEHLFSTTEIN